MIVREFYETRYDGVNLYRTYSDTDHYIHKVGTDEIYEEAIDVESAPYTYEETDDIIEHDEPLNDDLNNENYIQLSQEESKN
jgi:hypothetical protein